MRDSDGYPLAGVDEVPQRPPREQTIPRLVQLLTDANRREERANDALESLNRRYRELLKDYNALNHRDFCETCQTKKESTPEGGCVELCTLCSRHRETLQSLQRELVKKEDQVRYWQDCYETALSELTDSRLSQ